MLGSTGETGTTAWEKISYEPLHMDTLVLADQQKLTFMNSVKTLDSVTRRDLALIWKNKKKEKKKRKKTEVTTSSSQLKMKS